MRLMTRPVISDKHRDRRRVARPPSWVAERHCVGGWTLHLGSVVGASRASRRDAVLRLGDLVFQSGLGRRHGSGPPNGEGGSPGRGCVAQWPDAPGHYGLRMNRVPPWTAVRSWVPPGGVCPPLHPVPCPVWHGPFSVGVRSAGFISVSSPSVRS